jgi:hypothetical protein
MSHPVQAVNMHTNFTLYVKFVLNYAGLKYRFSEFDKLLNLNMPVLTVDCFT